jgi:hypothetical protein
LAVARKNIPISRADIQPLVDGWVKGRNLPNVAPKLEDHVRSKIEALIGGKGVKDRKVDVFESTGGQTDEVDVVDYIMDDIRSYLPSGFDG